MSDSDSRDYCAAAARRFDADRYLAALFAAAECRPGLFALYAFNVEIAKVREVVSEPALGRMRLQWWRDAVAAIYRDAPPRHAVVDALALAVRRHRLPREPLDRAIDGRELDLRDAAPGTLAALESYAAATSSSLTELALIALGADRDAARPVAHRAGVAWALAGLLRALPRHAARRRLYLPLDGLRALGLDEGDVFARPPPPRLAEAVEPVARAAQAALAEARRLSASLSRRARAGLPPLVLADAYLTRLAKAGYDAFDPHLESSRLVRQLRLTRAALFS